MIKTLLALGLLAGALMPARPAAAAATWWVAPGGADTNNGASNAPLASLAAALEQWRDRAGNPSAPTAAPARIILRGGTYALTQSLSLGRAHSPSPAGALSIEAAPGEQPILSGGVRAGPWHRELGDLPRLPAAARGHIWVTAAPRRDGQVLEFRELWVNGRKAIRARQPEGESLDRLVAWDKTNHVATVPAAALRGLPPPDGLEMVVDQVWEIAVLRVATIEYQGPWARLSFKAPESRIEFQHPWPPVTVNAKYQAPFFLANALEFLDQPGEWFEDVARGKIYYWPRADEDMSRAQVFVPALETLVRIEGQPGAPVGPVRFQGLTFAHTTWLRPSQSGHVPLQVGMFMLDAKKLSPKGTPYQPKLDNVAWVGRPPAAVAVRDAGRIDFENCTFEHLASAGLDFESGTHDDLVQGCRFRDLGGNGLQLGQFSATNVETHTPWLPADENDLCQREKIVNNLIMDCGNEDWGCAGIAAGYVRSVTIAHNEIRHLPYTGISLGWGWTPRTNALRDNLVLANYVHDIGRRLGDLGGIYCLSAQPGTVIAENCIADIAPSPYVPDPNHWFYLYLDEGSSLITVRDNWCPAEKFLRNANGPGNVWTNNGPQVAAAIKSAAGLEPAFRTILSP